MQSILEENASNLMPFIFANSLNVSHSFNRLLQKIRSTNHVTKMNRDLIEDGFQLRPQGKVKENVITMHYNDARIARAPLVFESSDDKTDVLSFTRRPAAERGRIERTQLITTFRTSTGVNTINASTIRDYLKRSVLKSKALKKARSHLILPIGFASIPMRRT